MRKVTISVVALVILLTSVSGLYLQIQVQYVSLEDKYSRLAEDYTALKNSYSELLATYGQQHFQRNSSRVIIYALGGLDDAVSHGKKIAEALEQDSRIKAVVTRNQSDLTLHNLEANFDAVVLFHHGSYEQPLLSKERIADLLVFAESDHMLVAVHHAIYDPNRDNPNLNIKPLTDYIGGWLPAYNPKGLVDGIEDNILNVVNSTHYLAEGVSNFTIKNDEVYYAIDTSKDIVTVISNKYYGPFVWTRGNYAVYIQMGHFATDFDDPMVRRILQNAVLHLPIPNS